MKKRVEGHNEYLGKKKSSKTLITVKDAFRIASSIWNLKLACVAYGQFTKKKEKEKEKLHVHADELVQDKSPWIEMFYLIKIKSEFNLKKKW